MFGAAKGCFHVGFASEKSRNFGDHPLDFQSIGCEVFIRWEKPSRGVSWGSSSNHGIELGKSKEHCHSPTNNMVSKFPGFLTDAQPA